MVDCKGKAKSIGLKLVVPGGLVLLAVFYEKVTGYLYGEENIVEASKEHEAYIDKISAKCIEFFTESSAEIVKVFTSEEVDKKVDEVFKGVASSLDDMSDGASDRIFSILRSSFDEEDKEALAGATTEEEVNKRVELILNKVASRLENIDKFDLGDDGTSLTIILADEHHSADDGEKVTGDAQVVHDEV